MPHWISLDGAVNVRDVGGLSTDSGRTVRTGRLIRSDNLQDLSAADVRRLVDDLHVRAVSDLRTPAEVNAEGPGPLTRVEGIVFEHNSLFSQEGHNTDAAAVEDEPVLLPWQKRDSEHDYVANSAVEVYWRYLIDRPDSILSTLRLIAATGADSGTGSGTDSGAGSGGEPGAVIVHCAAGKDRTGVVVAIALSAVGVSAEDVVADYAQTAERIKLIFDRLASSPTYAADVADGYVDKHRPLAETMEALLLAIDERVGGVGVWLAANGWTAQDQAALESALLD